MWWQVFLCCFAWQGDLLKLQYLLDRCHVVKQSTVPAIWHCLFWLQARWSCQYPSKRPLTITGCSRDTPKTPFANNHKPPGVWDTMHWLTLLKCSRKVVFQRSLTPKHFTPEILGNRFFWIWISELINHILSLSVCWLQPGRCDTSTLLCVCLWFLWVWDHSPWRVFSASDDSYCKNNRSKF